MDPFIRGFADELAKTGAAAARSILTPQSSNVRGFRYDPGTRELFITYKGGGTYRYADVPSAAARSLGRAKSVGKAVNKHIKGGGYAYEKIGAISWRAWGGEILDRALEKIFGIRREGYVAGHQRERRQQKKHASAPIGAESITASFRSMRKIAGVAKKQITWQGLPMKIEHEPGDIRSGKSKDGKIWERKMYDSYGYIPGTKGKAADGDAIDVYFSHEPVDGPVFMVRQVKKDTGEYDEDKYMVGFGSFSDAKAAYLRHMPAWAYGTMSQIGKSFEDFKSYLETVP